MKKLISLLFNTIKYYEARTKINILKNKKTGIVIAYFLAIITVINTILIAPLFYSLNAIIILPILLIISLLVLIIFLIINIIKKKSIEKLDYIIINTSIYKTDFFNYLKNDIFFNLKFSLLITSSLFFYQLLLYIILYFLKIDLTIVQLFIIPVAYYIINTIIVSIFFLIYYLRNKNKKSIFIQIKTDNKYFKLLIQFLISIIAFLIFLFVLLIFINNLLLLITISIFLTILLNIILLKKNIYKKSIWIFFFKNIKLKLNFLKPSLKINSFFKSFKTFEIFYPLSAGLIFFIILILLSNFIKSLNIKIIIFQSVIFSTFFIYKIVNKIYGKALNSDIKKPFTLSVFLFSILLIIGFLSLLKINLSVNETNGIIFSFKDFFSPYINSFNLFCNNIKLFINSLKIFYVVLIPVLFFIVFYINKELNKLFHFISNIIDLNLRKKLTKKNPTIIFGDSISLYPFLFSLISSSIILLFLYIGISPISSFFYYIFDTFKISEVFKFNFLTQKNITSFFSTIFYIFFLFIILKYILVLFSSILSHFILFNDEIIYYENKIYKNTILRIPLTRINYILIKQNIIEKIFDFGTLFIETIDKSGVIKIKGIPSIKDKNILIMDKIKGDI